MTKALLRDSTDPYLALLNYCSTPLPWCKLNPSELLVGHKLRTDLPQTEEQLVPDWPHVHNFRELDQQYKDKQKRQYDCRRRVRVLPSLPTDTPIWVDTHDRQVPGTVLHPAQTPQLYIAETQSGPIRRNRGDICPRPNTTEADQYSSDSAGMMTRSRTGAAIQPPNRLMYHV